MDNFKPLGSYPALSKYISTALSRQSHLPSPFKGANSLDVFKAAIKDGREFLPVRYQKPYVDVLNAALVQAEEALKPLGPRAVARRQAVFAQLESVFTVLAAPIVQLSGSKFQKELKAFLALSSNLYRRFIEDEQVKQASKLKFLYPDLDPLAFFTSDQTGPYALSASRELPITIIAKPQTQAQCLALWLADGHEVAGHGVHNLVEGLQDDLGKAIRAAVKAAFDSKKMKVSTASVSVPNGRSVFSGKKNVATRDFMSDLFGAWVAEISADAAGLINMGPLFVDSGMLLIAASRSDGDLACVSEYSAQTGFSEHPVDLVRVLLAIEMVRKLPIKNASTYATALNERLLTIMGGSLPKAISWIRSSGSTAFEVSLSDLRAVLPTVADAILNAKLPALSSQSLTEIMTWTEEDESFVASVSVQLEKGDSEVDIVIDARHIVSASLMALERASAKRDFVKVAQTIHATGIRALSDIYDSQCLLCLPANKPDDIPADASTSLTDLVRLVKEVKDLKGR
ncbi:MAG: hypothetical protein IAF58_20430 [Leptolyngbya sp.]|nr:hypothetical protein [Candidatus Melainabacteria bacterium]